MAEAEPSVPTEHRVASLAAVQAGETTLHSVGGHDVALFICKGKVVATNGQCPHSEGPLNEGDVEGAVLTCPWHGWQFDLETGLCLEDDSITLARYPVRIDGDDVMVTV